MNPGSNLKTVLQTLVLIVAIPGAGFAQGCVESVGDRILFRDGRNTVSVERVTDYVAHIAERDLYNSSGARLTDFRAVLQQDRANLHKTGIPDIEGDLHDQGDTYFTTIERRRMLSTADYYYPCDWWTPLHTTTFQREIAGGSVNGVIWVIIFRHPNGKLAVLIEPAG